METMRKQNQNRLSRQFTSVLFLILLVDTFIAVAIAGFHIRNEYIVAMQSRVVTIGNNLKMFLQEILEMGMPIDSLAGIDRELEKNVMKNLEAKYANVVDQNSKVIYSFPKHTEDEAFKPDIILPLLKTNTQKTFLTGSVYNTFIPIVDPLSDSVVGGINIGIPKIFIFTKTMNTLQNIIYTFVAFIVVTIVLLYLTTKHTIKPLEVLTHAALALGKGDLTARANVDAKNEIGLLAESFNDMAERLEADHDKLTAYTVELESRNKKLYEAHEHILQREKKLKDAQSQIVLSEKMASLGVLIAGVAHEINTPAGAIANVASDLRERIKAITNDQMNIHDLTREELDLLRSFTDEFINGEFIAEGKLQWKKGREVRKWLAESGVENDKDVVTVLSKYNLLDKERLVQYAGLLRKPWTVNLLDSIGTIHIGMKICESSINKISEIVKALKYYAYTDMDKTSLIDINENIQNVLVLMHNKLKYNIDVETDLKPLPRIHCTSEISQVWTNLVSNAHDAIMECRNPGGQGILQIKTGEEEGWINVHITDNGNGISDENKSKMFDPFFTTKGIGKGTGLGLSIVSGIIKKHKGQISVKSIPGETTFTVSLPKENGDGGEANEQ